MSYAFTLWHGNGLLSTFRSAGGRSSALRRQLFRLIPAIKRRSPALYHLIAQSLQKPNDPNPLSACHCFSDGVRLPPSLLTLGSRPVHRELAQQLKGQKKKKKARERNVGTEHPISNVIGDLPTAGRSLVILMRAAVFVLRRKLPAAEVEFQPIIQFLLVSFCFRPLMFFCSARRSD